MFKAILEKALQMLLEKGPPQALLEESLQVKLKYDKMLLILTTEHINYN